MLPLVICEGIVCISIYILCEDPCFCFLLLILKKNVLIWTALCVWKVLEITSDLIWLIKSKMYSLYWVIFAGVGENMKQQEKKSI